MTPDDHQPTTEQCLYSIALSLIEINRELRGMRRLHLKAHRFDKQMRRGIHNLIPPQKRKPRTLWARLQAWWSR